MPQYQLDALGWFQFERLCQALLHAEYGLAVEAWAGAGDRGRDAYAEGPLAFPDRGAQRGGPFVFQAKFVQGANAAGADPAKPLEKAVKAEIAQIAERRGAKDWLDPRVYALLTNAPLSPGLRRRLDALLQKALPACETVVLAGAEDLDTWLDAMPNVRVAYPQILGLRDLRLLLDEVVSREVRLRSNLALQDAAELAEVFVPTRAYSQALTVLSNHGFVVLTGPPEMGKTAIGRMIALVRFTSGWEAVECRGPKDVFDRHDPEARQVFLADDAFGSTEYRPDLAQAWEAELGRVLRLMDHRHSLIWTSRPGPLREGLAQLNFQGRAAANFPTPAQVRVDASYLSEREKALMLYRHAKRERLSDDAATWVRRSARKIVAHEHFTPLRIERLVQQLPEIIATQRDLRSTLLAKAVEEGLQEPTKAMRTSFAALDPERKQLLIAMLDAGASSVDAETLDMAYARRFGGIAPREALDVARTIEEHFVNINDTQ